MRGSFIPWLNILHGPLELWMISKAMTEIYNSSYNSIMKKQIKKQSKMGKGPK